MEYSINPRNYIKTFLNFANNHEYYLNINNPKTIQEKLAWLNLYDDNKLKTKCANKIKLHEYCKEKLGKDICIPLIKTYNNTSEINWDELPDKFVIKCNHGSGMNIIVKDKNTLNISQTINQLNQWLHDDFTFRNGFEAHYHDIHRKIFIEEYMNDGHDTLHDYKFWCFNGEPKLYTINDGNGHGDIMYYKMNDEEYNLYQVQFHNEYKKPNNFEEMKEFAKILSNPFKFVRVDFYEINGKTYLGELTFTPGACLFKYKNHKDEIEVGNMLDLKIQHNIKNETLDYKNKDVCVVIPIYKDNINNPLLYDEVESIYHTLKVLKNYDAYFLCDPSLNTKFYKQFNIPIKYFNYKNREEYSNMCLNYKFYEMFNNYKYMLICQTDAYVFKDELLYWCNKGYDYIGAVGLFTKISYPYKGKWDDENVGDIDSYPYIVMNGGFSLRNIKSMYDFCFKNKETFKNETFNEDCVICWYHWNELNMAPHEDAIRFSAENQTYAFYPKYYNKLPFGCHTRRTKYKLFNIFNIN